MADGGEGTVDVFLARGAERETAVVCGPLGARVDAVYAMSSDHAVLEMASASGLGLLDPSQYDPMHADTYGTGDLMLAALHRGAKRLILGIGGSATNDAGIGMLRALGVRFRDSDGATIDGGIESYLRLEAIDMRELDSSLRGVPIEVAVDVDNPLCGANGAARTFAAPKGANDREIEVLDQVLSHFADVAATTLGHDMRDVAGAGAAGGLGFALLAFLGATMQPGVALIAREAKLDERLDGAALCMTGEGKIDAQTLHGKTVAGVGKLAHAHNVPVVAFGGAVDDEAASALEARGITVVRIAPRNMAVEESMKRAAELLETAAATATRNVLA